MLKLDQNNFQDKKLATGLLYREFRDVTYVEKPVSAIQKLNIFVPLAYFHNGIVNGYDKNSAPIFMPNTVGGYMPGPRDYPGNKTYPSSQKTIIAALNHGYVVVSAGLRGRTLTADGKNIGKAPAFLVDMKAAIRYVRHNRDVIPGDVEKIITNGTSAGGATSAAIGTSGDAEYFEPFLKDLGAADESDKIFAASVYCPIHNLEHADAAYEWEFSGVNTWQRKIFIKDGGPGQPPVFEDATGTFTAEEVKMSDELKQEFITYLNSLHLTADQTKLTLDSDGKGSFLNYVKNFLKQSAQKALDEGKDVSKDSGVKVENGIVTDLDWSKYLRFITRMKSVPAFDDLEMKNPEPNLFGDGTIASKHFTTFSQKHSKVASQLADEKTVTAINPLTYIGKAKTAKYWRIRHGASDRDTSFAIPVILATTLKNAGYQVDFAMPWNTPHSGDYDLRDLFSWIDKICAK
ncbi:subtype B tannase [Companilactobacillus sp. HBUAS59544]|uniref:subtype B tannase n=1 Tax=Companilactobacillus sp. HBUAS59544 TaxID=3109363 RepID=UPI002FF0E676